MRSSPCQRSSESEPSAWTARPRFAEQRLAELLPDRAECDGVDGAAVAGLQPGAHMGLADLLGIGDGVGGQRDHRLRIAGAERAGAGDGRDKLGIGRPRGQRAVDQQRIVAPRRLDGRRRASLRDRRGTRRARPCATVMPAAMAWPPPLTSRPSVTAWRTARPRSTPGIERPEPVPMSPGPSATAKAGRPNRSFEPRRDEARRRRDASAATPSPPRRRGSSRPSAAIASASASATAASSIVWRSRLRRSSSAAIARGFRGVVAQQQHGRRDRPAPIRPPALMRGPSMKPRCHGSGGPVEPRHVDQRGEPDAARAAASRSAPWRRRRG